MATKCYNSLDTNFNVQRLCFASWCCWHSTRLKLGQLILKCFFGVFNFFQKTNENKSTWGIIVVKSNSFVRFLEETSAWKNRFDFVWPLAKVLQNRKRIKKYKKYCKIAKVLQNRITPLHSSAIKGLLFVISNTSCLLNLPWWRQQCRNKFAKRSKLIVRWLVSFNSYHNKTMSYKIKTIFPSGQ